MYITYHPHILLPPHPLHSPIPLHKTLHLKGDDEGDDVYLNSSIPLFVYRSKGHK